jgi:tripartite-type tricarboxylate transporter receptor subunit TctC
MRPLAVSSLTRSPNYPDVPTIAESAGLAGFDAKHYTSMLIKAGTPQDILNKLSENVVKTLQVPAIREKLSQSGDVPTGTLAEAAELYAKEYERWPRVVKEANIKL